MPRYENTNIDLTLKGKDADYWSLEIGCTSTGISAIPRLVDSEGTAQVWSFGNDCYEYVSTETHISTHCC